MDLCIKKFSSQNNGPGALFLNITRIMCDKEDNLKSNKKKETDIYLFAFE